MPVTISYGWVSAKNIALGLAAGRPQLASLSNGGLVGVGDHGDHLDGFIYSGAAESAGQWLNTVGLNGDVAQLSNGNLVVVSQDENSLRYEIRDTSGAIVLANVDINELGMSNPAVTALSGGGFWVAGQDLISGTNSDIRIYRFDNDGVQQGSFVVDASVLNDNGVALAGLENGNVAVAWTRTPANGISQMYHAIYTPNGALIQSFLIDNVGTNRNVSIVAMANGAFAIAYEDNDWTNTFDITLVTFDAAGGVTGGYNVSNPNLVPDGSNDANPSLAFLSNGMLAVAYTNNAGGNNNTIVNLIDPASGAVLASATQVTGGAALGNDAINAALSSFGLGQVAVVHADQTAASVLGEVLQAVRTSTGDVGEDIMTGDSLIDHMNGGDGTDTLNGAGNDDILDGGAGADTMRGGQGNDLFKVDNVDDMVIEFLDDGIDQVEASLSYTLTVNVENLTLTGAGNVNATGNALNNVLIGNSGANILNGLAGADTMAGGLGDDTYIVDNAGDVVTELSGQGSDTVESSIDYTLGANVENLTLTGAAVFGYGNGLANVLIGNAGNNTLNGFAGADTMTGKGGDDIYYVDNAGDVIVETGGAGRDSVRSTVSYTLANFVENITLLTTADLDAVGNGFNNTMIGNAGANTLMGAGGLDILFGNAGNDVLDGGLGADKMYGGEGDDTYYADAPGDFTFEGDVNWGVDTVISQRGFSLGANIDNLIIAGVGNYAGSGNLLDNVMTAGGGANTLTGRAGNDTLDGGAGNDKMYGGEGNDIYYADSSGDIAFEGQAGWGHDIVYASVTFTLSNYVDELILTGSGNINATGSQQDNILHSNSGDNVLRGRLGDDRLQRLGRHLDDQPGRRRHAVFVLRRRRPDPHQRRHERPRL